MRPSSGMRTDIGRELKALADPAYRDFSSSLLPGTEHILGVRLPVLRRLAKRLAREDWRGYLEECGEGSFEEIMLQGFLIGYAGEYGKASFEEILERTTAFLPKIGNWSVCDSFCATLKTAREHPAQMWDYVGSCLRSEEEFTVRFALVMLLDYYIEEEWIDSLFPVFDAVRHPGYYVKMAVAWALSMCYVRFPAKTQEYLEHCGLDDFTYNKALQKITESLSVDRETKVRIRAMKRKGGASRTAG